MPEVFLMKVSPPASPALRLNMFLQHKNRDPRQIYREPPLPLGNLQGGILDYLLRLFYCDPKSPESNWGIREDMCMGDKGRSGGLDPGAQPPYPSESKGGGIEDTSNLRLGVPENTLSLFSSTPGLPPVSPVLCFTPTHHCLAPKSSDRDFPPSATGSIK